jgi:hypothetical protein
MNRLRQLFSNIASAVASVRPALLKSRTLTALAGGLLLLFLLATSFGGNSLGQQLIGRVSDAAQSLRSMVAPDTTAWNAPSLPATPVLRNLPSHPNKKLSPYMNASARSSTVANPSVLEDFRDLLDMFVHRQAVDDNFTVRVIDRRSDEVLEVYELTERRRAYRRGTPTDWRAVDGERRTATRRLVDKYERQGVPLEDIIVRWGRANQIEQAQERDRPYQAYEIQLAQHLGLSLLPTQIGTVETFNQDDLVSSAGAMSRYQMMPWLLRRSGVNEYALRTEAGTMVDVEEAYHPLLTLEPAFLLLRGYVNAVGHEIPGLSAYHTGPGNIYMLFRKYFTESNYYKSSSTVVDAYIWAITQGFDTVSEETSFGAFSRGYVPSAYGALQARNRRPLDLSETIRTAQVQLKPGARASLRQLLTVLDTTDRAFNWGPASDEPTTYARFRALNKHFDLPASSDGIPAAGNVQLVSTIDGKGVRFFLPPGAPKALRQAGLDVLDPDLTFRFNESTYAPPTAAERTVWDRRYAALVDDIEHFGFTPENRQRLLMLHEKFAELAEDTPSHYRQRQLKIIDTHRRIWLSNPWDKLSELTLKMTAREKVAVQPPVELPDRPSLTRIP